jgi:hypothetical protein
MTKVLRVTIMLLLSYWYHCQLIAQTTLASIPGKVLNNKQKTQPGASVTVRNESIGFAANSVTNAKGQFAVKELPLGGVANPPGDPFQVQLGLRYNI